MTTMASASPMARFRQVYRIGAIWPRRSTRRGAAYPRAQHLLTGMKIAAYYLHLGLLSVKAC